MYGIKYWIIPIIMLIVLTVTVGVGIYQLNSNKNPWNFGGSNIPHVEENSHQK